MSVRKKKGPSPLNIAVSALVVLAALYYFSSSSTAPKQPTASGSGEIGKPTSAKLSTSSSTSSSAMAPSPSTVTAKSPISNIPAAIPSDRATVTEASGDVRLPPDLQAQVNAPPPELPEDLKRQLAEPPPELPADLQAQLNAPPPEIPEDIKRALQTPPRIVSIDEVNNPKLLEENARKNRK